MDGKKYKYSSHKVNDGEDENAVANPIMKTETTEKLQDRSVASLKIQCPYCDKSYDFPEIFHKLKSQEKLASNICPNSECSLPIPDQYIANRVQLFLKQLTSMYYKGSYKCREPSCGHVTRELVNKNKCVVTGCKGRVASTTSESQVNDTLRYLQGLFNVSKYMNELALKKENKVAARDQVIPHQEMLDHVLTYIN